ncbi:MAG: glycyl-radical enzyme activating protein [Clostridia bacterium]|nr:glycyl-radical enzyme activating protein [Clostridia bacterium]
MQTGTIFDIKGFALNDGPGIRTTVFLKGCPLRCLWCHNPEGLSPQPELYRKHSKCAHCGKYAQPCEHDDCRPYGCCLHVCPNDCLSVCGYPMTSAELAERLLRDRDVYEMSGGGVTFSGGEPLMQHAFVSEVLDILAGEGISAAMETSSFASPEAYRKTLEHIDYVMADLKLFDWDAHIRYTGVPNDSIKQNLRWLMDESWKKYVIRVPLIPGITDTDENLAAIGEFVGDSPVELLPYNALAGAKYPSVGKTYPLSAEEYRADGRILNFFSHAVIK